jgi:hypothetical protein
VDPSELLADNNLEIEAEAVVESAGEAAREAVHEAVDEAALAAAEPKGKKRGEKIAEKKTGKNFPRLPSFFCFDLFSLKKLSRCLYFSFTTHKQCILGQKRTTASLCFS